MCIKTSDGRIVCFNNPRDEMKARKALGLERVHLPLVDMTPPSGWVQRVLRLLRLSRS